jgi:hypothetical protein
MPWVTQDNDGSGRPVYFVAEMPDDGVNAHVDRLGDEPPATPSNGRRRSKRRRTPRRRRDRPEETPA